MRATSRSEIVDAFQRVAEAPAIDGAERELLDAVEAIADRLEGQQRPEQPGAEQATAHGRDGAIDLVQERSRRAAFAAFHDLEMLQRDRIDQQAVGREA